MLPVLALGPGITKISSKYSQRGYCSVAQDKPKAAPEEPAPRSWTATCYSRNNAGINASQSCLDWYFEMVYARWRLLMKLTNDLKPPATILADRGALSYFAAARHTCGVQRPISNRYTKLLEIAPCDRAWTASPLALVQ